MPVTISLTIADDDHLVLLDDIIDMQTWLEEALAGRINAARTSILTKAADFLKADPDITSIPATDDFLIQVYLQHPAYKNRRQREDEREKQIRFDRTASPMMTLNTEWFSAQKRAEESDLEARARLNAEYQTLLNKRGGGFATPEELVRYDQLLANITSFSNL